jgi:hypothetical protein
MSQLQKLKKTNTLPELAVLLGIEPRNLSFGLYKYRSGRPYGYFQIDKRSGGRRTIAAPNTRLKYIQKRLSVLLAEIETELRLEPSLIARSLSHGFKKQHSIVTNASIHRKRRYVFNVDLKDFFPAINFGRVYGFFCKDKNFELDPKIATILAQIVCHENQLPQGSPCSPVISNLIGHILDIQVSKLARRNRCSYTRYADDLTFSTNEKEFPSAIARQLPDGSWIHGDKLGYAVFQNGFQINNKKTRMQFNRSRQTATGLIVNDQINVRREYYKRARAMCHSLFVSGYCTNGSEIISDDALDGIMSFIFQIRRARYEKCIPHISGEAATIHENKLYAHFKMEQIAFTRLYRQFLDYISFYGMKSPKIICEGKTDNIYIKSAIREVGKGFPNLIAGGSSEKISVEFFNYSTRTSVFQDLSGGTGQLKDLLIQYRGRMKPFTLGRAFNPVIMVVDNDKASDGLFNYLSKIHGKKIIRNGDFIHVFDNLYVVPVPIIGHEIEDLFDNTVLNKKLDGRTFNRSNKSFDEKKEYGKNEFATKIISPERKTIDFSKFSPMLKQISWAIDHYRATK